MTQVSLALEGIGDVLVPEEFQPLLSPEKIRIVDSGDRADEVLALLSEGWTVLVSSGDYEDLRIMLWYVMKFRPKLARAPWTGRDARRDRQREVRRRIHRLVVLVKGEGLVGIRSQPDLCGLLDWASWKMDRNRTYMVPARRISRILTDIGRSKKGIEIGALGASILILPHVYIPFDQTIVNLVDGHIDVGPEDMVLDMGTGTGVLAFVAARKGARKVIATDILPNAVEIARLNAQRLGLSTIVEVRDPGDLFAPAPERFDVIVFNPPWIVGEPSTIYDRAIRDPEGTVLSRFMDEVGSHLKPGGRIYVVHSEISRSPEDRSLLRNLIAEKGMMVSASWTASRRSRVTGSREAVTLFEIRRNAPPSG